MASGTVINNSTGILDWSKIAQVTSPYTPTEHGWLYASGTTTGSNGYVSIQDVGAGIIVAMVYFPSTPTGIGCNCPAVKGHSYRLGVYNSNCNLYFVPYV